MSMIEIDRVYLEKAQENLAAAQSEFVNGRYNSCASRAYYACFQAAIYALARAGIRPAGHERYWRHDFVQSQFNGQLINRQKAYPATLRSTLTETYAVRVRADYMRDHVSEVQADRTMSKAEEFVDVIRRGVEQHD